MSIVCCCHNSSYGLFRSESQLRHFITDHPFLYWGSKGLSNEAKML